MEIKEKTILCLGDSITEGAGSTDPANRFVTLLGTKHGMNAVNFGIGGTRIARKTVLNNERFDNDYCKRIEELPEKADILLIFGGTNDYGHGDAVMGNMSDSSVYTFYGACKTLFTRALERYPLATIFVLTPLHRLGEDNKNFDGKVLRDYVDAIRETAEYFSLPVLDLWKNAGMQPNIPEINKLYFADGLHPNDRGHEKLADMVAAFLKTL